MSWSGLTNKQTITFDNLQDAVANDIFIQNTAYPCEPKPIGQKKKLQLVKLKVMF